MSSILDVTTTIVDDHYLISASLEDGGTLPAAIFIYTNTGDGTLGDFFGTCNVQELGRLAVFTPGTPQPTFGNRNIRHSEAKIKVPLDQDPSLVVAALVTNVKSLSLAYQNQTGSVSYFTIP